MHVIVVSKHAMSRAVLTNTGKLKNRVTPRDYIGYLVGHKSDEYWPHSGSSPR